jgi:hypothetical protein
LEQPGPPAIWVQKQASDGSHDRTAPVVPESEGVTIRRHRQILINEKPNIARKQFLGDQLKSVADIHFSVILREDRTRNVLMMFEPVGGVPKAAQKKN